ncbi:Cpn60_TCP1 domain-containing protein/FYVE domain-containing protein/PIP5K domain-containing protein [Cephalotus follicularis]|uniref:1-phosphatidylinositol-3-phosphate 5-kinase n=1 Tax=Cephalotus follicularis TaxID=3775 RepID=A0A1Q3BSS8_CEPFO|nr:Cpn60_TCP1 domain-containing protein/FYVE domain-containing protein/PIP5K domain-containing protein [Cephalotus follicularis]
MGTLDNKLSELVDIVKYWIPWRSDPTNVSRDFWMPDHSCRVCYECDSQFTVFNRRHHCRLCGRVFCAKCTANSIPAPSDEPKTGRGDCERIRVCNYCFKQWEQGITTVKNGTQQIPSPVLSPSPSTTSLASTKSSCTCNSSSTTVGSTTVPYQRVSYSSGLGSHQSTQMNSPITVEQNNITYGDSRNSCGSVFHSSPNRFGFCINRSDDGDDGYGVYHSDLETRHISQIDDHYGQINVDDIDRFYGPHEVQLDGTKFDTKCLSGSPSPDTFDTICVNKIEKPGEEADECDNGDESEGLPYDMEGTDTEPVDFENNGLLWLPPEPEDEEDEREAVLFDDDDDDGGATGEWGYLRASNRLGGGEFRNRDKSSEEHRKAMKTVVEGHFRALVSQLLQVENLPVGEEYDRDSWLGIITSLSWEAASILKPDTSKGGKMDPGGYVKVKCIACGRRSESMVVKGVVCKKNVAHRRMTTKIDKPRFLILGGALEYQRVSNHLSSFDTLLQQEMDHLKMAVAKIDAHHPDVLLVEKSVSRYAQDYLLEKDISLVLNMKGSLLERIAICTGAQIIPSIDHLTSKKLGYCEIFHVEKFLEEHGSAGQGGKKLTKTLMFFEGCPKPFGCTILLKGANGDELKKVKHVVQYGVFAAYHLALETSFLADEGASLPELPLKSPITVALPDKPSRIDRSISTIPGFTAPATGNPSGPQSISDLQKTNKGVVVERSSFTNVVPVCKLEGANSTCLSEGPSSQIIYTEPDSSSINATASSTYLSPSGKTMAGSFGNELFPNDASRAEIQMGPKKIYQEETANTKDTVVDNHLISICSDITKVSRQHVGNSNADDTALTENHLGAPEWPSLKHDSNNHNEEMGSSKEEFPPSSSDYQSILVSLSTRCVWKGTVCERAHLFRIKYYGSFDKPLGRFLRDHLFDQSYRCCSCNMPSEAHVHCYTHRQGTLTISVKKLPENLLPGERDGKIWMWHRCLRCPRTNGFPPATRRVVMSDAAWGLSFGKFLELSFSNHAAASRVASCGHSLHRDCLRFYGFGRMVACFRYASIDVHSVYLPPSQLEFNNDNQDWIRKEANQVLYGSEVLFTEVHNALYRISENLLGAGLQLQDSDKKASELKLCLAELEWMRQKHKEEFEEAFHNVVHREVKVGQPAIDILDINKLQRQILFCSYLWDQHLIHVASLKDSNIQECLSSFIPKKEKIINYVDNHVERNATSKPFKAYSSCNSFLLETNPSINLNRGAGHISQSDAVHKERDMDLALNKEADLCFSTGLNIKVKSDHVESGNVVRRVHSEGDFAVTENLSATLAPSWTGENHPSSSTRAGHGHSLTDSTLAESSIAVNSVAAKSSMVNTVDQGGVEVPHSLCTASHTKSPESMENSRGVLGTQFLNFHSSLNKNFPLNAPKHNISEYNPVYVMSLRELERRSGARLLLPLGVNDIIVPVYDDEPTSIIAYALVSSAYHAQMFELERQKDAGDSAISMPLFDSVNLLSLNSFDDANPGTCRNVGSSDESILFFSGSRGSQVLDPLLHTKDLHARVSFTGDGPLGKVNYTVTCYYAKRFETLRRTCCPSELDFVRSLSRCKKWGAQGGKSNVFFAKTLDDRFIIKQVTKTELESFIKFGPAYFKNMSESISTGSPTCLAKILGIYQVSSKHPKGGKESKIDVLVMENLLFRRNVTRLYDLKGSSRSRYNADTTGTNKVLLDQNLIEAMPTSPIFVGNKAKRLLERAVWNDTSFLASIDVMDYSLLVGVDEERHELVLGIIDFMRQYTWDKHLETWVKTTGILGGPKNTSPTVISPQQYKKRFRKAMTTYFLMVPDQWSPSGIIPSGSELDLCEDNLQGGNSLD